MRNTDIKDLYNTYLRISRKKQNKPYKLRQNWEGFESSENYLPLLKLKSFFDRNHVVNIEDFFVAPYEVYPEDSFYELNYYNTISAVKVYGIYCNLKNNLEPDSDSQIDQLLRGLKFIRAYCTENKIPLSQYLYHKEEGAIINAFVVHLKEKNISIYNLFPFKDFEKNISSIDFGTLKFILNDIANKISVFRGKFYGSKKCKKLSTEGLKMIEKEIQKNIS